MDAEDVSAERESGYAEPSKSLYFMHLIFVFSFCDVND